jgi:hypothetical protein
MMIFCEDNSEKILVPVLVVVELQSLLIFSNLKIVFHVKENSTTALWDKNYQFLSNSVYLLNGIVYSAHFSIKTFVLCSSLK